MPRRGFRQGRPDDARQQAVSRARQARQRAEWSRRRAREATPEAPTDPIERLQWRQKQLDDRRLQARRTFGSRQGFDPATRTPTGLEHLDGGSYVVRPSPTSGLPTTPRTQIIGYDAESKTIRVLFRDGTPWNYYDVPASVARDFRRVQSPGQFINRTLNSFPYSRAYDWDADDPYLGIRRNDENEE